ncbi:J domain-containing protein [Halorubellus sp. JP-L1]|uniref:J domain-containing protein n=1 Tax=Halorubellus sp. JP-L1 TaxID=2715753 RepID=UPI00140E410A|nr:J domain-containing protein [Halorubellus sp. JP-L1]NHN40432.1 J domain-containing protein [Halorubellus sp. JP-L1]
MAVVDRRGCDGCGRDIPVEDLTAVSVPGDEHAVCCPECREHAESVADDGLGTGELDGERPGAVARQRGECEGCGATDAVDEFETMSLPDGSTVAVCEDCREHAASMSRRTDVDGHRGECSGCEEPFDVSDMVALELDDGTTVACCDECAKYARAAARTTTNEPDYDADAQRSTASDDSTTGDSNAGARPESAIEEDAETALVESPSICEQCGDWVDVELFEVVTVHDRVEEFCPPCKDRARRNGVVRDVRMRRAEAYDVLDVDPGRAEAVVRDAYLSRIKAVHPDSDGGSREAFRRVQRAYERLTD